MKLVNYGAKGQEKAGILDSEQNIRSLAGFCEVISSSFLAKGGLESIKDLDIESLVLVDESERIGAPLLKPRQNYRGRP